MRLSHIIPSVIAALFILLFIYTGILKLSGHDSFESVLHHSPLLKNVSQLFSWLVPLVEIGIAILLFIPPLRKKGLLLSLLLMSLFTVYIAYMIYFTPHLPCSCGGVLEQLNWPEHLVFNLFLTGFAAAGYLMEKKINDLLQ